MSSDTPDVRDLTRQLIEREPVPAGTADADVAAVHGACERIYGELTRWVGSGGCLALFRRALLTAQSAHAALAGVRIRPDGEPRIEGVAEAVRKAGSGSTAAGLEELLRTLIDLLSRFIGEDMVVNLVNRSTADPAADGAQAERREG